MTRERVVKLEKEQRPAREVEESGGPPAPAPLPVRNMAVTVLAVLAVILGLKYLQAVIIPIVLGALLSYALEPIVAWMVRRHVQRSLAAAALLLALFTGG